MPRCKGSTGARAPAIKLLSAPTASFEHDQLATTRQRDQIVERTYPAGGLRKEISACLMAATGWKRPFDDPIPLHRGRQIVTLEEAARYIQKLPKAEQQIEEWQAAVEALLLVVENDGPSIGVMRAMNRHVVREFNPDRKDTHWGKRKLKRDQ